MDAASVSSTDGKASEATTIVLRSGKLLGFHRAIRRLSAIVGLLERPSLPTPAPAFNSRAVTARSEPRYRPSLAAGLRLSRGRAVGYLAASSDERSQIFSVLSKLPLTIRFPLGLKLTLVTSSECPLSVSSSRVV